MLLGCNDALGSKLAGRLIGPIVAPKRQTIICSWNSRTVAETTHARQVAKEMKEYGIEGLGIIETRWKGSDK